MNERIKLLAEQADRWSQKMTRSDDPRYGGRPVSGLFEEKFAELIVCECANLCDEEAKFAGSDGQKDASASNCANRIKEHFGVEQ